MSQGFASPTNTSLTGRTSSNNEYATPLLREEEYASNGTFHSSNQDFNGDEGSSGVERVRALSRRPSEPSPWDSEDYLAHHEAIRSGIVREGIIRSLFALLCLPLIGILFLKVGLSERGIIKKLTINPTDWIVITFVGFCVHMSAAAPIVNILAGSSARDVLVGRLGSDADWLGPFIVYPATCVYFASTAIAYVIYSTKRKLLKHDRPQDIIVSQHSSSMPSAEHREDGQQASRAKAPPTGGARRPQRDLMENIQMIKAQIQEDTVVPSWVAIPFGIVMGFCVMLCLRVCAWSGELQSMCNTPFTFNSPAFDSVYYHIGTAYWFLTFTSICTMIGLGLISYYQQLMQIEQFTYISRNHGEKIKGTGSLQQTQKLARKLDKTKDLFSPKNLSIWISVWKELLRDLRERPAMQAICLSSVVSCAVCGTSTVSYVIFDNLYEGSEVAEFTAGCIAVFIFCVLSLSGFLAITVRLQYVVDYQIKAISETQTYVQRQWEFEVHSKGEMDPIRKKMLRAKVNVLQALDTVLRTSESKPKLIGLSLETIRWMVVIVGLAVMNLAFFVLYRVKCF